jgi:hypothetical protein
MRWVLKLTSYLTDEVTYPRSCGHYVVYPGLEPSQSDLTGNALIHYTGYEVRPERWLSLE